MMPRAGVIKSILWETHVRQTILKTIIFENPQRSGTQKINFLQRGNEEEVKNQGTHGGQHH